MKIASLIEQSGGYASRAPVKKTVTWQAESGPVSIDLHFLVLPAGDVRRLLGKKGEDSDAAFIAACIVDEDGTPGLTIEQSSSLTLAASSAIIAVALTVNGLGKAVKDEAKNE